MKFRSSSVVHRPPGSSEPASPVTQSARQSAMRHCVRRAVELLPSKLEHLVRQKRRFADVHRPPLLRIKILLAPSILATSFLLFPSECRGFTCISEDSSEITFLLVENYNLTAPSWLMAGWGIFGKNHSLAKRSTFCLSLPTLACRAWQGRMGWEQEVERRMDSSMDDRCGAMGSKQRFSATTPARRQSSLPGAHGRACCRLREVQAT